MIGKRVIALFVMTLVTTATPAVYQIGIEPRIAGAACDITITSLEIDQEKTGTDIVVFNAYLRIENRAPVQVILSRLALDVYHYSSLTSRYQLIGSMNTSREYVIPAAVDGVPSSIQTVKTTEGLSTTYPAENDRIPVVATLGFYEDSIQGTATTEAIGELISRGYLSIQLKGTAQVGPFKFEYERYETISLKFWDPNFVVEDVFPFYDNSSIKFEPNYATAPVYEDSGVGKYVVHLKMHNPSGISMVLEDYNFSLVDTEGKVRATGILASDAFQTAYDPDVRSEYSNQQRAKIIDVFKDNEISTILSADPNNWNDLFLFLDFNDQRLDLFGNPYTPDEIFGIDNPLNSQTRDNIAWFFKQIMSSPTLQGLTLRGSISLILGWREGENYKGIYLNIGEQANKPFNIYNVNLHQKHYTLYDNQAPVSLQNQITPGMLEVDKVTVDSLANEVTFDMVTSANYTNPYRLSMQFSDLSNNYYRISKTNAYDYSQTYDFAETDVPDLRIVDMNRAYINKTTLVVGTNTTVVPYNISLIYDANTYIGTTGISKALEDLQINPQVINWTDIFQLMSPTFMNVDPLVIIKNLIDNGLDPIMLLNKTSVTNKLYSDGDAYYPIQNMFFGDRDRPLGQLGTESWDMTKLAGRLTSYTNNAFMRPVPVDTTWAVDEFTAYETKQWDFAQKDIYLDDPEGWDWDLNRQSDIIGHYLTGIMVPAFSSANQPSDNVEELPEGYSWRVYGGHGSEGTDNPATVEFGYWYDYENRLKNYYTIYDSTWSGAPRSGSAFLQNFTLRTDLTASDINKASMSISYRYPQWKWNHGTLNTPARFGLGQYVDLGTTYAYDYTVVPGVVTTPNQYDGFGTTGNGELFGVHLLNPKQTSDWQDMTVDITDIIQQAYSDYALSGNIEDLKFEFGFGTNRTGDASNLVYFDDAVIYIEYSQPGPSPFEISDLFKYTEEKDPIDGNMWNLLSDTGFDATKFVSFLGNDMNQGIGNTQQSDLGVFMQTTDVSISNLTHVMEYDYEAFEAAESTNFLDLLNQSRYIIPKTGGSTNTQYGWRDELNNYWVIEDPYAASKAISDGLARQIHIGSDGNIIPGQGGMYGEELWSLFNNLGVYMPWITMYLSSKGWSKDDIFDMLEALGFASEVKANYANDDSGGKLETTIRITARINILGEIINSIVDFELDMGQTVIDGYQELFRYLMAPGDGHVWAGDTYQNSRPLIESSGTFGSATPWNSGAIPATVWFIPISVYMTVTPIDFDLNVWMTNLMEKGAAPTSYIPADNPYLSGTYISPTEYNALGFNDAGSKVLGELVRNKIRFQGKPFVSSGGDPIGLFQYLDNYYFTETETFDPVTGLPGHMSDYSSYTLLDYFDVKSVDFVDLITGYNWLTKTFDPNGDGTVDDWRAPATGPTAYGGGYVLTPTGVGNVKSTNPGFGNNAWNQRIYWNPMWNSDPTNGGIMWSDSPALLDLTDGLVGSGVDHEQGAPPVVSLIDMLAWLSKTTGTPDPDMFFKWIIGELGREYHQMVEPVSPDGELWGLLSNPVRLNYKTGIGLQSTWEMLRNATFNVTGMFNYFQNLKKADPFKLMWEMDDFTGGNNAPDPKNLMYYALNPNLVMDPTGALKFFYHDSLGATLGESKRFLWQLFNASYWQTKGYEVWNYLSNPTETLPYKLIERMRELELNNVLNLMDDNLDFNLFYVFVRMKLDASDWWNEIQYDPSFAMSPLNVIYAADSLNITKLIQSARNAGLSSRMKVNGTLNMIIGGLPLTMGVYFPNTFAFTFNPTLFTAAYHWSNFLPVESLRRANFVII
jgi:hypothetical protein